MEKFKLLLTLFMVWMLINLIAYITFFDRAYRISWIMFAILTGLSVLTLLVFLGSTFGFLVTKIIHVKSYIFLKIMISSLIGFFFTLILNMGQVYVSSYYVYSPSNAYDAYLEEVNLNDTKQWISVRTKDDKNPIILFLAGGPGGTQMSSTREFLSSLEDEYTIVNWDQPGVGKSYDAHPIKDMTVETYVEDAHALTTYLKNKYQQEKIYLIGESWGSYLGILLSKAYPEDYYAFVGTGQMVDFTETELFCYQLALDIAIQKDDQRQIKALNKIEIPPIYGDIISFEMGTYLQYIHLYMLNHPEIKQKDWDTFDTLFSPEYSIMDSINFARGLTFTFSQIYQQLYGIDLRETHTTFEIPIYFLHGSYDFNAPGYLVEDYYNLIDAPNKELIWFEHSGHNPWINESELFNDKIVDLFNLHSS